MIETSFSELRARLKHYFDRATDDREAVRVRRRNGPDVVLLAAAEYDSLAETAHLLASPRNADRLHEALARARARKDQPESIGELREDIGL